MKAGPIQMGEFGRMFVSRRLFALRDWEIAALMAAMRQVGSGFSRWSRGFGNLPLAHL